MRKQRALTNAELASFCGQAAMLLQAGFTPSKCIRIMLSDAKSESGKQILKSILEVCTQGDSFYKALDSTGLFPSYVVNLIRLGEKSGNLDVCMQSLADFYEKEQGISDNIRSALTYPLIMVAMMIVVIYVLISRVLPIFNQVFEQLGGEMAGLPTSLLTLGDILNRYSVILLVFICILTLFCIFLSNTVTGRDWARRFFSIFPPTRRFYESLACERFSSGLSLTMHSGIDTLTGLDMVAQLVDNHRMKDKIEQCQKQIREGANFSEALTASGIFNNLYSQMISVGFRSGHIELVLNKIATTYEKETDKKIQSLIAILEPSLVIILSVIVGMILLSVILPLMGVMTSIG